MSYKINDEYEVSSGEILSISKNEQYNCLSITLKFSYYQQGYPACRTKGGYIEQIEHLKEVFEVQHEDQLIGKKCIVLNSFWDMFCIYNPENKTFFSLNAKFFPEQYVDALNEIKSKQENEVLDTLDNFNALMLGVVMAQKNQNADTLILSNIIKHGQLKEKLEKNLVVKQKSKNIKI